MWAYPYLVIFSASASRGLNAVFDAVFNFNTLYADANCIEIKFRNIVCMPTLALRSIASWH